MERRELGLINPGGPGTVTVDGTAYSLARLDGLYAGSGSRQVIFDSLRSDQPAPYFLLSSPAHATRPTAALTHETAEATRLGSRETASERTVYKYIHPGGLASCQLVMGLTVLEPGSVWNTMPAHTHDRRMGVYCYFDLPAAHRVFHLMGPPDQTRHVVTADGQTIVSPPWSIHAGCGTVAYSFIWGMAGENRAFTDMDFTPIAALL